MPTAVRAVVNNYSARAPWLRDDLEQEAIIAMMVAKKAWKPGLAPLDLFQAKIVARELRFFIARSSSPVSATREVFLKRQFQTETLDPSNELGRAVHPAMEFEMDLKRAVAEVVRILDGVDSGTADVILGESPSREVAKSARLPIRTVYKRVWKARQQLHRNPRLKAYLEGESS